MAVCESKGQNWESDRVILQRHSQPTGGVSVAPTAFSSKKWSEWLWKAVLLEDSRNYWSWIDFFSKGTFRSFLFIVRTGLKSAELKCGVSQTTFVSFSRPQDEAYLPGREVNHDHEGGSSRARLLHCTQEWLTPAISPNVGNSTSSFLLVGICVRANPFNLNVSRIKSFKLPTFAWDTLAIKSWYTTTNIQIL